MKYIIFLSLFLFGGIWGAETDYALDKDVDSRECDLKNEKHQQYFSEQAKQWILDAQAQLENEGMPGTWKNNEMYNEGLQVPLGFSDDYLAKLVKKATTQGALDTSKFRVQKLKNGKMFFVDNKIGTTIDAMASEYTDAKKVITVKRDSIDGNNGIENALRKYLESLEERKKLWERFRIPAVEDMQIYGLAWVNVDFNNRLNNGFGDIEYKLINPRDVLVDPKAKMKYFENAKYIVHKIRMEMKEAQVYFAKFNIPANKVVADNDYESFSSDQRYHVEVKGKDRFVTVYRIEYKKVYTEKIPLSDNYEGAEWLGEIANEEIEVDRVYHYEMFYNRSLGVVLHKENEYTDKSELDMWQFKTIPYYNKMSKLRLYPISEVEKLKTIQDIINISESIIMNNATDREKFRAIVHKTLATTYGDLFTDFIEDGGILPVDLEGLDGQKLDDYFKQVQLNETGQDLLKFLDIAQQTMKDHSISHEVLQGNYPDKGSISGVAVQRLQQANLKRLNYKDTNINYSISLEARLLYRIMAQEFSEPDFVTTQNAKKGEAKYVPIQTVMTIKEFEGFLQRAYPETEMKDAWAAFEKENDVQYQIAPIDKNGKMRDVEEIKASGSVVYINFLTDLNDEPYALTIKVYMDFSTEKNELQDMVEYAELLKMGKLSLMEYYKKRFPERAEEMYDSWIKEQGMLGLAEQIQQAGPEAVQMVQSVLQGAMQKRKAA